MPTLNEKYKVPHFDGKGEGEKFFMQAGVPTTFFYPSFYWENFIYFGAGPKMGTDGKLALTLPIGEAKLEASLRRILGNALTVFLKKDIA